ncbi:MAG: zinc ABC transporter substrate-binding protein [Elusimicrobiota bacterium]|nr:zinc ABC transporter substrate-binding protein [Elusimicrobiota bacterium]
MKSAAGFKNSVAAAVAAALFFCACGKPQSAEQGGIKVLASGYAVYAIAREVLRGTGARLDMLVPAGAEPHSFEPPPQTALQIKEADFFFFTDGAAEPWAMQVSDGRAIALAYNLPHAAAGGGAHAWLSFENAAVMAENMAAYIARRYPQLERMLAQNAADFARETQMLDRLFKISLESCESRIIYHIGHNAFGHTAADYDLVFKPLAGAVFEAEPSPRQTALMIKEIKNKKIRYIFTEEAVSPALARTVAAETGAQPLDLYTIEHITKREFEEGTTYKQFMIKNLENLKKGLSCI